MRNNNYVPYHIHSQLSNGITNIDSITDFHDYVDAAKELGIKAFAFAEHGNIFNWVKKKEYIESCGMKYIHAIEAYLTEDDGSHKLYSAVDELASVMAKKEIRKTFEEYYFNETSGWHIAKSEEDGKDFAFDISTLKVERLIKTKDNYHCVLIAKNHDGVRELNRIISKSFDRADFHYYYAPRITLDELFSTSDNIIVTTSCLGSVMNRGTVSAKERMLSFLAQNKHRCFLEIQHHNCADQIEYNKMLYSLSKEIGVPLIAGTDTHALNEQHLEGRSMLQKAKSIHFADEDAWDLTFKSYDDLVAAYKKQKSLPMDVVYEAIENTNVMADTVEEFSLDRTPKYPKLYDDSETVFKQKINAGVIERGINKLPNYKEYIDRIRYEYDVYKHNGAIDFMLLEENYKSEMRKRGIRYGYSRGSVSGSIIAYLLHITEIDSVKYNLNFSRFMSPERISLAD